MEQSLSIVTYNLRCLWNGDGVNSFCHRAGLILEKISAEQPDIICFQEAWDENMAFLKRHLKPSYTVIFNQRCEGLTGEGLAVAFRNDRITLYGLDIFWLSETPRVVASRFEGQSVHPRICQNMIFKDEMTGKVFRIYNLHLEDISEAVRVRQMQTVFERLAADRTENELPFFILGDLNAQPGGEVMTYCYENAPFSFCDLTEEIPVSFHDFGRLLPGVKIDYIITDEKVSAYPHTVSCWMDCTNGIFLSDHYPIRLDITL